MRRPWRDERCSGYEDGGDWVMESEVSGLRFGDLFVGCLLKAMK